MYFEKPGRENTEKTISLAIETAKKRGIKHIVVASNSGETAKLLMGKVENIVSVALSNGAKKPGENSISCEDRKYLEKNGVKVYIGTHVLSGAERALSKGFGGILPVEIMAQTLKFFGQGTKVCVEVSTMALDGGLIPYGEDIIAIGGSSKGADTAVIMKPEHANNILKTKIKEIICKPSEF